MLANYTELQQEIADTLHRSDLTSKIPSFIKLFEVRANRELRMQNQDRTDVLTLALGTQSIPLPTGFIEALTLSVMIGGQPVVLRPSSADDFAEGIVITKQPTAWRIFGNAINFDNIADQNYTVNFQYLKKWDIATDVTNDLLTHSPDAYLYGSLAASAAYIGEDDRLPLWANLATTAIEGINLVDARSRRRNELQFDPGLGESNQGKFNISSYRSY